MIIHTYLEKKALEMWGSEGFVLCLAKFETDFYYSTSFHLDLAEYTEKMRVRKHSLAYDKASEALKPCAEMNQIASVDLPCSSCKINATRQTKYQ